MSLSFAFSVVVSVTNTVSNALSSDQPRKIRFLHVAFNSSGDSFIAGDCHGNIYLFDLHKNRYVIVIIEVSSVYLRGCIAYIFYELCYTCETMGT